jgi:hypothetical protein
MDTSIPPCSLVGANSRTEGVYHLYLQSYLQYCDDLSDLIFGLDGRGDLSLRHVRLTLRGLHPRGIPQDSFTVLQIITGTIIIVYRNGIRYDTL